jgi:MFS family permease
VLIGSLFGSYITMTRRKRIYALGMTVLGLFLMASGLTDRIGIIAATIGLIGAAGATMDLLYQVQAAELSRTSDRSVAMASMGLGWNFSYLTMPIFVTWLAETLGFASAFLITGFLFLLIGSGSGLWHRLLEPAGSGVEELSCLAPSSGS